MCGTSFAQLGTTPAEIAQIRPGIILPRWGPIRVEFGRTRAKCTQVLNIGQFGPATAHFVLTWADVGPVSANFYQSLTGIDPTWPDIDDNSATRDPEYRPNLALNRPEFTRSPRQVWLSTKSEAPIGQIRPRSLRSQISGDVGS